MTHQKHNHSYKLHQLEALLNDEEISNLEVFELIRDRRSRVLRAYRAGMNSLRKKDGTAPSSTDVSKKTIELLLEIEGAREELGAAIDAIPRPKS